VFIFGFGLGPAQSLYSIAVQNAVQPHEIGVATAASQFFRQIGQTIGVAAFGALLTNNLSAGGHSGLSLSSLQKMTVMRATHGAAAAAGSGIDYGAELAITHAMQGLFWASLAVLVVGVATTQLIPSAKLKGREPIPSVAKSAEEALETADPGHTPPVEA